MLNMATAERDRIVMESAARTPSARWALASLSLAMLLASLDTSIANVALPTLAHAFSASFQAVQWVVLANLLTLTALIVSVGRLGDITGRRRLLLAGISLFTVASVLSGLAPTLGLLIAARAAQGVGGAIMMALTMALVGETGPKEKTGSAMGLLGTMSAIGTALGPSLGGVLISGLGWRAIFLVNVPLGIAAWLLARRHLPADRVAQKSERAGFDPVGTLLLALTLAAYALAVTIGRGQFGPLNAALLLAAVFGVGLFVLAETRVASPLIRLSMFRDRVLSGSLATSALVATVVTATLVVGPFYLSRALGLDAARVGLVLSAGPLVAALTAVPAGRLADRFGAQRMTIVGLIGMAAGSFALALLPAMPGLAGFIVPIVVITAGYGMFQTANNTAVMTDVSPDQRGRVSGLLNLSRNLGRITGASVMGAVFALAAATSDLTTAPPDAVATGMRATFAVATMLIVVALAIAVRARAQTREPVVPPASCRPSVGADWKPALPPNRTRSSFAMTFTPKTDWLMPAGLIALSLIPMAGGAFRLVELGGGAQITPDNARFFAAPFPVVLHIVSSVIFCVLGAVQFAPGFRRRRPDWHRVAGRFLVLCGLVSTLTGLWMTQTHPPASFAGPLPASYDGPFVYVTRLLAGSAMAWSLVLGVAAVLRRDLPGHRAWMIRGYALGLGAGTQAITHLPWFLFPDIRGELARALCMAAGWAINVAVAEWLIAREQRRPVMLQPAAIHA